MKFLVSPQDEPLLAQYNWHQAATGYIRRWDRSVSPPRLIGLHRQIMGDPPDLQVDHINGDPSDNRRENLRLCTNSQNIQNRGKPRHNTSGFKGVWFDPRRGKYRATLRSGGMRHDLGSFDYATAAAEAYDKAALIFHGKFAVLNFPSIAVTDSAVG